MTAAQRRYREILREIQSHLSRNGMCRKVRDLRRSAPKFLNINAIRKTREDANAIAESAAALSKLLNQATLSPELRLRLAPEMDTLLDSLERAHQICAEAAKNQPGRDTVLHWCARTAFSLLVLFSDKRPTSGSAKSPYRVIASLLYEVVTGEPDHDLRRACDDHLKTMRILMD